MALIHSPNLHGRYLAACACLITVAAAAAAQAPRQVLARRPIHLDPYQAADAQRLVTLAPEHPSTQSPALHVSLSSPIYHIQVDPKTGAPIMPRNVVATAEALNWPAGVEAPKTFTWRVALEWDFKPYPTHHSIQDRLFVHTSPFKPDLSAEVRGGILTVYARTELNGKPVFGLAKAEVRGENPPRSMVLRAFPRNRTGLIASKIGVVESGLRQFTDAGMPVLSRTNDVGMMQLNAPTGAVTAPEQVWDWRANLERGLQLLGGKRQYTVLASRHAVEFHRIPAEVYYQLTALNFARYLLELKPVDLPSDVRGLSTEPGSGLLPGEPDPDHLAPSQVEREAIRRYNGGAEYAFGIVPEPGSLEPRALGWQVDPTRGGIAPTKGDPNYVVHVLAAHSGFSLAEPARPVKHRGHRRHGRRRHRNP